MPKTIPRKVLQELLEVHGPLIEEAFLKAISDMANQASIRAISDALTRADYERALDILGMNEPAFDVVVERVNDAYRDSGRAVSAWINGVSAAEIQFQFQVGNPVAAEWLRSKSSTMVSEISEASRASIREALRTGMEAGRNPRTVALDIAGRIPKGANTRSGGLVGLTRRQTRTVSKIRNDLKSADPDAMRAYLRLKLRDKRFDSKVLRAIKTGEKLSAADIENITARYSNRALKWRADNIARTEANQAFHAAQDHSFAQAIEGEFVDAENVTKIWRSAGDERVRFSHSVLNNQRLPHNGIFVSPIGSMMKHPGDRSLGASSEDIVQCRCRMSYEVNT